jgi:hypothetical protein
MNHYRKLFYSFAIILPMAAIAAVGAHAATTGTETNTAPKWRVFQMENLTDAQKAALEQAQALRKQAYDILEKAGIPSHRPMMQMHASLTDAQKAALEEAKTLRQAGKNDEAKAVLEKAGLPAMPKFGRPFGHRMQKPGEQK